MKTRAELEQENAQFKTQLVQNSLVIESKNEFISQLKEALVLAHNRKFTAATESLRSLQSELFNESEQEIEDPLNTALPAADEADTITVPTHQRKRGGRKPLPEDLPRIDVVHDLSDVDKVCPHDGAALKLIGEKTSEQCKRIVNGILAT